MERFSVREKAQAVTLAALIPFLFVNPASAKTTEKDIRNSVDCRQDFSIGHLCHVFATICNEKALPEFETMAETTTHEEELVVWQSLASKKQCADGLVVVRPKSNRKHFVTKGGTPLFEVRVDLEAACDSEKCILLQKPLDTYQITPIPAQIGSGTSYPA